MKKFLLVAFSILASIFFISCGKEKSVQQTEVTISAAASLKEVMGEIIENFESENKNIKININLGGSGALKNQIIAGAPVDIVFFASRSDLDDLNEKGMVEEKYHGNILKNRMIVAGKTEISDIKNILGSKVAIGTPETVPAGKYAQEIFKNAGIWESIQPDLIFSKDVRSAAQYVDLGEVDYALIYKTDAKVLKNSKIVYTVPEDLHTPIVYSYGIIKDRNSVEAVVNFYNYLTSDKAIKLYEKYNFEMASEK